MEWRKRVINGGCDRQAPPKGEDAEAKETRRVSFPIEH